jgi:hypothetical protein
VQDLPIVMADLWGHTWLTVELRVSNAGADGYLRGLPILYLGPVSP